jgi:hypothetical protein
MNKPKKKSKVPHILKLAASPACFGCRLAAPPPTAHRPNLLVTKQRESFQQKCRLVLAGGRFGEKRGFPSRAVQSHSKKYTICWSEKVSSTYTTTNFLRCTVGTKHG